MPAPIQPFFKYDKLQDPKSEIRLLQLQPDKKDGLLQFNTFIAPLSSAPPFKALSYEWGFPGNTQTILVNRVRFVLQQNLDEFLNQIYAHHANELPINIWVDAVCINQDMDDEQNDEKNHQVRMMASIYSRAVVVLAWLGEVQRIALTNAFLQSMPEDIHMFAQAKVAEMAENLTPMPVVDRFLDELAAIFGNKERMDQNLMTVVWDSFEALWECSYWTRLWVVQELVMARDFAVMCAPQSGESELGVCLSKDKLRFAYLLIFAFFQRWGQTQEESHEDIFPDPDHSTHSLSSGLWKSLEKDPGSGMTKRRLGCFIRLGHSIWVVPGIENSLEQSIFLHGEQACSDAHDVVYGFLGMHCDIHEASNFQVNYRSSLTELLLETILFCQSHESLSLGATLMNNFGLAPIMTEHAADLGSCVAWGETFISQWLNSGGGQLSKQVTIQVRGPHKVSQGPILRFDSFSHTLHSPNPFCFFFENIDQQFVLAEADATADPFQVGRNSDSVVKCDFFQSVAYPRLVSSKTPEVYLMDITLKDLLWMLTCTITMAGGLRAVTAQSDAAFSIDSDTVRERGNEITSNMFTLELAEASRIELCLVQPLLTRPICQSLRVTAESSTPFSQAISFPNSGTVK